MARECQNKLSKEGISAQKTPLRALCVLRCAHGLLAARDSASFCPALYLAPQQVLPEGATALSKDSR